MKVQNPIIGRAKGSAGGMTACKMYDKNVLKAKAFEVNNPKTPAQTTQRNFFREVQEYANQFSDEQLKCLFPQKPKGMSRRSMLAKQLAEFSTTSGSVKSIDFASLVTLGNAAQADLPNATIAWDSTATAFKVSNLNTGSWVGSHGDNFPVFIVTNVTKGEILMLNATSKFSVSSQSIGSISGWVSTDTCKVIVLDSGMKTAQTGFGSFIIKTRKAKTGRNQSAN